MTDIMVRAMEPEDTQAILDLADNWYNLHRVELQVYADNEPAINLYRKVGFMVEGTHRAYAFREGAMLMLSRWRGFARTLLSFSRGNNANDSIPVL